MSEYPDDPGGSLRRALASLRRNGFYVFAGQLIDRPFSLVRNKSLAMKLGVRRLQIGRQAILRGLSSIHMGEDFSAADGLWLDAITSFNGQKFSCKLVIGKHVRASRFVHIAATHSVSIGDNVLIGSKVIITDHNHGQYSGPHSSPEIAPWLRPLDHDRRVVIGNNVWLGDGVVVTPGASIGEGSVIGANSVVTNDIPAFTIAAGVPAKVLKVFNFGAGEWSDVK